jgi:hypothetical protein
MSTATAVLGLEKAGFTREQVEALAAYTETQLDLSQLVTKADLRTEMAQMRTELQALEHRMTLRLGGIAAAAVAIVAIVATLVKLL